MADTPMQMLTQRIEDLPGILGVGLSDRALNIFIDQHIVFANGSRKLEGVEPPWFDGDMDRAIDDTFDGVKRYREEFEGDVFLTWRAYPEITSFGIYTRLSFTSVADVLKRFAPAEPEFADAVPTLGERRSSRTHNGADWSPRDLLVKMLRDHDSGALVIESMVVSYQADKHAGFWAACPNRIEAIGLLSSGLVSYAISPMSVAE